jgi:hypothetical protein
MAYSDISTRISELSDIAENALSLASSFMSSMETFYSVGTITPPTADVVLDDPTYKPLTPPPAPGFDSGSSVPLPDIHEIKDGEAFSKVLAEPPVFHAESTLSFSEEKTTWLIDNVRTAIRNLFNETGFESAEIEIWNRGIERKRQALKDSEDISISTFSARGFTMPNDMINRALDRINAEFDDTLNSSNNEITLGQLDLAQKNAQLGINAGLDGEALLMGYFSRMAGRALSAAKASAGFVFEVFSAKVIGYNAQIRANRAQMKGAVEIESSQIEAYEASLEAKKTEIEAMADNLSSVISGYKSLISSYRSEISADRSQAGLEMSWRKAKYRENIAGIRSRLETAIIGLHTGMAAVGVNTGVMSARSQYYVNYLAAALSSLQVMVNEETLLKNTESA